jgi:shikimate kinase/3-dehydroquinate synthase
MGTGKSTVGGKLAKRLSYSCVDTDSIIVEQSGLSIADIFQKYGEEYFRNLEKGVIRQVISERGIVISVGGGAIVDPENLSLLKKCGVVICLKASPEQIASRLKETNTRPLLSEDDRVESIKRILKERERYYDQADESIDTSHKKLDEVVEEIMTLLEKIGIHTDSTLSSGKHFKEITVGLGERAYPIYFTQGGLENIGEILSVHQLYKKTTLITNPHIMNLYGYKVIESLKNAGFEPFLIKIPDGERYKTLNQVNKIYDKLLSYKMDRYSSIVALGGGVIGDVAGFAAATYMRGVPYVQVPTTLLAQVDSSVGGKTGVNHPAGKNLIGAFYQPKLVFIDVDVLKTLKERDLKAGLAEVVKYGILSDEKLFSYLEKNTAKILNLDNHSLMRIIKRSCEIKAKIVEEDEREKGVRTLLNLGHTFGHAIELLTNFKKYRHGEAVALGIVLAADFSFRLGLCAKEVPGRIRKLISGIGLSVDLPKIPAGDFMKAMELDKKIKGGKVRLILIEMIGKVVIKDIEWKDFSLDLSSVLN